MTPIPVGPRTGAALAWGRRVTALLLAALLLAVGAPAGTANAQAQADLVDTAVQNGSFTTLAAARQAAGLVDPLKGPGPSVQGEPIRIAVSGGTVRLNGTATVAQADVVATNGVIHVIDTVLLPPSLTTLPQTGGAADPGLPVAFGIGALLVAGFVLRSRRAFAFARSRRG